MHPTAVLNAYQIFLTVAHSMCQPGPARTLHRGSVALRSQLRGAGRAVIIP